MAYKMLVVDDSQPMRSVIKKTIRAAGYGDADFLEASNGREALAVVGESWLDLVVTDYNMPDMNGMEMIEEFKKDAVLAGIPVLVVTTEGSLEKVEAFLQMGAAGYIKKPFSPEQIREKIVAILGEPHGTESEEGDAELDF
ncbi:two-component system chemotaxis response regulator CheY [Desulfobotulus alkaliphilus]|uniref:Two-component system chemotaxis response regulator CheY n=1 Tax=Desulfobotulus alkaliphilus TaxID=622671 RepID=A0A562R4B8_9BACT|nr:response regulator [Desulfobotulus alkaliphilus]TWI63932.1 two-component system chemotaxis response regulator CheY [Desulfobotulus alkaliphilus]